MAVSYERGTPVRSSRTRQQVIQRILAGQACHAGMNRGLAPTETLTLRPSDDHPRYSKLRRRATLGSCLQASRVTDAAFHAVLSRSLSLYQHSSSTAMHPRYPAPAHGSGLAQSSTRTRKPENLNRCTSPIRKRPHPYDSPRTLGTGLR